MKTFALQVACILGCMAAMLIQTGCANILPDQDKVLVSAERSTALAFDTVDGFLKFDSDNREILRERVPSVHAFAEQLRKDAPAKFREARTLTKVYETTKSAADGQAAADSVAVVEELARQARLALIQAQAAKARS